ncbi:hypothetical protein PanWU01x14_358780, partial [Parasponia andersonii]
PLGIVLEPLVLFCHPNCDTSLFSFGDSILIDSIWQVQNDVVHNGASPNPTICLPFVRDECKNS